MKQSDVDRAVARATGESVNRIRRIGFSLMRVPPSYDLPVHDAGVVGIPLRPRSTTQFVQEPIGQAG
jgi:hypothetical protein